MLLLHITNCVHFLYRLLSFCSWSSSLYHLYCISFLNVKTSMEFLSLYTVSHTQLESLQLSYKCIFHYNDVIMGTIASQITSLTIVYSIVYSDADQIKHQSSASLAFVRGIHRGPVNSPHKWPVTRKMFPFDDVIMHCQWPILVIYVLRPRYADYVRAIYRCHGYEMRVCLTHQKPAIQWVLSGKFLVPFTNIV